MDFRIAICGVAALAVSCIEGATREEAIVRGSEFLVRAQDEAGYWSDRQMPALTALPLWALARYGGDVSNRLEKAAKFILSTQQEDGGFYVPKPGRGGSGLGNYNTSVCLSALFTYGKTPAEPLLRAREYIASTQLSGDDTMAGGFGYDKISRRRNADLSNTSYAMDAMRRTESLEELRKGSKRVDIDWSKALKYVESMVVKSGEDAGGAVYSENYSHGGSRTNTAGVVSFRAYGSMSYAAILSMCHAKLDRSDPRVKQTLQFCAEHWSIDENPGLGSQGLYYYYDILSRALSASGVDKIGEHDWKKEISAKLVSMQNEDGSWSNDNNRFWESDPVLCTSFAILTLQLCE